MEHLCPNPRTRAVMASSLSTSPSSSYRLSILGRASVITLTTAVALPLLATAQEITDDQTSPIVSSTIDSGAPGDVIITDTGSVSLANEPGVTAVTIDSNNSLDNEGDITVEDSDNAVGVRVTSNLTGDIQHGGTISVTEDYTREDDDDDGDLDGPLAIGTGRIGILLESGGTHTGNITTLSGSSILVEGNQSAGIQLLSGLDGSISLDGAITVTGDDALGVEIGSTVSGDVLLSGGIIATGENAVAVEINGNVGGALTVESSLLSTGFTSTTATNYISPTFINEDTEPVEDRLDAEALLANTGGMILSGSVADGLLINGAVDDFISQEDVDDETKDTIEDFDENRGFGSVRSVGPGTALLITPGASGNDLIIGTVTETVRDTLDDDEDDDTSETLATFNYDFGFINRGQVVADGQNIGFAAQAVRIEGNSGTGQQTIITGGIENTGSITATAFEADALGLSLGAGSQASRLVNSGDIEATTFTSGTDSAVALELDANVGLTTLTNSGDILAESNGESGTAIAIVDRGGQLTSITNTGGIGAALSDSGLDVETRGDAIAIDLSAHGETLDVTLVQQRETPTEDINGDDVIDDDDVRTPFIFGDVQFGAGSDIFDLLAGSVSGDIDFGTGDAVFNMDSAELDGNITVRDGNHSLAFSNSEIESRLTFANSIGQVSFSAGSNFTGSIRTNNSTVDLLATDSRLQFGAGRQTALASLDVSGTSELVFRIDPSNAVSSVLNVAGEARIAEGVTVTPVLTQLIDGSFTQTLISADSISFGGDLTDVALTNTPFLYSANLIINEGDQSQLDLSFETKTAAELGFDTNQAAAYSPLLAVFGADDELGAAITTITTEDEFNETYNLLLPQRTNASTQYLMTQTNASFGALGDRLDVLAFQDRQDVGIWVQEHFAILDRDSDVEGPGFNGDGLGFSFGADRRLFGIDNVGLMLNYSSGTFEETTGGNNPVTTSQFGVGGYIQEKLGPIQLRAAAQIANASFSSDREISVDTLLYEIQGEWDGTSQAATLSAATQLSAGNYYLRPQVSVDWFSLEQDGYTETGGDGLLDAEIGSAETDNSSASALLTFGRSFDFTSGALNVEATGGYRSVLSSTPFETTVRYLGADESFNILAPEDEEAAAVFGVSLVGLGSLVSARVGYDLEVTDLGETHYLGASLRIAF